MAFTRFAAPPPSEPHGQIGMRQPRERRPQNTRTEHGIHEPQHGFVADVHVVAVGYENIAAREGHATRRKPYLHAAFPRKIFAAPHVVVAYQQHYPHPAVSQLGQLAQRTSEALGDHLAVLEPEIEDVARQKYGLGILRRHVEPPHETPLHAARRLLVARSEMNVRGEIVHYGIKCFFVFRRRACRPRDPWPRYCPSGRSGSSTAVCRYCRLPARATTRPAGRSPISTAAAAPARR